MVEAVVDAMRNDRYIGGENVVKFEEEFARFIGVKHAIATNSGTSALQFILESLNLQRKSVVTTPMSFIASANAVLHANGVPVFGDIRNQDYCLDPERARERLSDGASALLPVHIFGHPADMEGFRALSEEYDVPIIEDACQAHGAEFQGKRAGSIGRAAAFSFYTSKNLTVLGDGGMITTNDDDLALTVRKLGNSGRISKYEHDILGFTSRLNSLNAAIGRVQLRKLVDWNNRRRTLAALYFRHLSALPLFLPAPSQTVTPVFHQFVVRTRQRDRLKEFLESSGVECGIHYPLPIHLQPLYRRMYQYREGMFPISESFAEECLSLPMHPLLADDDVKFVCERIQSFFSGGSSTPRSIV